MNTPSTEGRLRRWLIAGRTHWRDILAVVADVWTIIGISVLGFLLPHLTEVFGVRVSIPDLLGLCIFYFFNILVVSFISIVFAASVKSAANDFIKRDASGKLKIGSELYYAIPLILFIALFWIWVYSLILSPLKSGWANMTNNQYLLASPPQDVFSSVTAQYNAGENTVSGQVFAKDGIAADYSEYRAILYTRRPNQSTYQFHGASSDVDLRGAYLFADTTTSYSPVDRFFVIIVLKSNMPYSFSVPNEVNSSFSTDFTKYKAVFSPVTKLAK